MRKKERHAVYEAATIGFSGIGLALAVPTLVSAHDTIALLSAGLLALAWFGWALFFLSKQIGDI